MLHHKKKYWRDGCLKDIWSQNKNGLFFKKMKINKFWWNAKINPERNLKNKQTNKGKSVSFWERITDNVCPYQAQLPTLFIFVTRYKVSPPICKKITEIELLSSDQENIIKLLIHPILAGIPQGRIQTFSIYPLHSCSFYSSE